MIVTYYGLPFGPLLSRGCSDSSAQKPHSELNPSISSGAPSVHDECTVSSITAPSPSHQEPATAHAGVPAVKPTPTAPVPAATSATSTSSSKDHPSIEMPPPLVTPSVSQQPQQAHASQHAILSQLPSAALLFQGHPTSARLTEEYRGIIDTSAILMNAIDDAMMDWE